MLSTERENCEDCVPKLRVIQNLRIVHQLDQLEAGVFVLVDIDRRGVS